MAGTILMCTWSRCGFDMLPCVRDWIGTPIFSWRKDAEERRCYLLCAIGYYKEEATPALWYDVKSCRRDACTCENFACDWQDWLHRTGETIPSIITTTSSSTITITNSNNSFGFCLTGVFSQSLQARPGPRRTSKEEPFRFAGAWFLQAECLSWCYPTNSD